MSRLFLAPLTVRLFAARLFAACLFAGCLLAGPTLTLAQDDDPAKSEENEIVTPEQIIAGMEADCARSAEKDAGEEPKESLYLRLGGTDGIHAITREIVRLHQENEAVAHFFPTDEKAAAHVAERVAQWMIMATGGPADAYDGPSLTESHRKMNLTNADFMAAGGDVKQAMVNLEYGDAEINEVMCALVQLRAQVVLPPGETEAEEDDAKVVHQEDTEGGW